VATDQVKLQVRSADAIACSVKY